MYFIDGINKKCIMLNNFDNSNYDIINYIIFNNPLIFIFIMIQLILFNSTDERILLFILFI